MLIEVRTDSNIQGGEQFSDQVTTVVQAALDRFGDRIRRVDVHLSDAVGDKAGHDDKCCKIEARRDGREPIVVTHHEATMDQAIRGAVHSLRKSVERLSERNPRWINSGSSRPQCAAIPHPIRLRYGHA